MKKTTLLLSLFLVLSYSLNAQEGTKGEDVYDYDNAQIVLHIDQKLPVEFKNYVCYTKSLKHNDDSDAITVSVEVVTDENYYTIELVTWGIEGLAGGGLGNTSNVFAYNVGGWNYTKDTQAIYAKGHGFEEALKDLEMKFNGLKGDLSFTATGDPTKGEAVITIKRK